MSTVSTAIVGGSPTGAGFVAGTATGATTSAGEPGAGPVRPAGAVNATAGGNPFAALLAPGTLPPLSEGSLLQMASGSARSATSAPGDADEPAEDGGSAMPEPAEGWPELAALLFAGALWPTAAPPTAAGNIATAPLSGGLENSASNSAAKGAANGLAVALFAPLAGSGPQRTTPASAADATPAAAAALPSEGAPDLLSSTAGESGGGNGGGSSRQSLAITPATPAIPASQTTGFELVTAAPSPSSPPPLQPLAVSVAGTPGGAAQVAGAVAADWQISAGQGQGATDIRISHGAGGGLDIGIGMADAGQAVRVAAGLDLLRHQLHAIGSDVEAIRVEVRPERVPDGGTPFDSANGRPGEGQRSDSPSSGQGQRHLPHAAEQAAQRSAGGNPMDDSFSDGPTDASASGANGVMFRPGQRKVDRYA